MRVQIVISPEIKIAAEVQAATLGYTSLAAMLRVVVTGLARDYEKAHPDYSPALAAQAAQAAAQHATPASTNLPPPSQFSHWPEHIPRTIHRTDPGLYRLMIENGQIY